MRLPSFTARTATLGLCLMFAMPMAASISPDAALARDTPTSFADLAEKLLPAVVNVSSKPASRY